jgi:hypothetical protein
MSYVAISSVTKALIELLSRKLNQPHLMGNSNFRVTSLPPDDERVSEDTGVNLFLYRLTENQFLKNMPWQGDRAHPGGSSRPPLALTLNYFLTGYAKKVAGAAQDDVTAHQLLGKAMSILHEFPVLNDVHDSDFDADLDTQFAPELRKSFDKVKISWLPISIDEFSKIWTGFSKAYRLSVAYEVSLVQIAAEVPALLPAPAPARRSVRASTMGPPSIASILPPSGAAGTAVSLIGTNFTLPGQPTKVTIGGVSIEQSEFDHLDSGKISVTIPADVSGGPNLSIVVSCGGFDSEPVTFQMRPWISSLQPIRGITGIPISIPFQVPSGATALVKIGGLAAVTTVDPDNRVIRAVVPLAIATNGPAPVVLTLDDGTPQNSNALLYEVLPLASSFSVTNSGAPAVSTVTVTGERLRGSNVYLKYNKLQVRVGDVTDPVMFPLADTAISFNFDRVLLAGGAASLIVDGRPTNSLPRALSGIDPPQARPGDLVTFSGVGLSGRSVSVKFGATALPAMAQPFATRFSVPVPSGLPAGPTTVHVAVDGTDVGDIKLVILG